MFLNLNSQYVDGGRKEEENRGEVVNSQTKLSCLELLKSDYRELFGEMNK